MKKGSFFVLMFHGLVKEKPAHFLYRPSANCFVREDDFESIVKYCKKKYRILKLDDLASYFDGTADEDGVLLTFDDGLKSLYALGLPILKKYNASATVFITPGWTNKEQEPAVFSLEYHLYTQVPAYIQVSYGEFLFEKEVGNKGDIAKMIGELWDNLFSEKISPLSLENEHIQINGESLSTLTKQTDPENWKTMSWQLLQKYATDGTIEIGAHGQTHTPFTWLTEEQLDNEFVESKQQLLDHLNIPVVSCSFPHGLYNEETLSILARHFKYGFANAVVTDENGVNNLRISRYNVPYQRPNNITSLVDHPFMGKVLRKLGHLTKLY
jgi:peptidoglycan/xylan/chitin deacetylase (PgdA/CDA1 family)